MISLLSNLSSFNQSIHRHFRNNLKPYLILVALAAISLTVCAAYTANDHEVMTRLRSNTGNYEVINNSTGALRVLHKYIHKAVPTKTPFAIEG